MIQEREKATRTPFLEERCNNVGVAQLTRIEGEVRSKDLWLLLRGLHAQFSLSIGLSLLSGAVEALILINLARLGVGAVGLAVPDDLQLFGVTLPTLEVTIVLIAIRFLASVGRLKTTTIIMARLIGSFRLTLLQSYARASWSSKNSMSSGEVTQTLLLFAPKMAGHTNALVTTFGDLVIVLALIVAAGMTNLSISLILVSLLSAFTAILIPIRRWIQARAKENVERERAFVDASEELPIVLDELTAYGVTSEAAEKVFFLGEQETRWSQRLRFLGGIVGPFFSASIYLLVILLVVLLNNGGDGGAMDAAPIALLILRAMTYSQGLQNVALTLANFVPMINVYKVQVAELRRSAPHRGDKYFPTISSLQISDSVVRYGGEDDAKLVIDHLLVESGDRVGIIGPSGSGKTTLLKLVGGLLEPASGTVLINGVDRRTCSPGFVARHVGYVPQYPKLVSGTVLSNVRFFRPFLKDDLLQHAIKSAALGDEPAVNGRNFSDERLISPDSLSGGQQQRVGIARCLAGTPEVLVLDEPTSALDMETQKEVLEQLFLNEGNRIVLVSTHDHSVLQYCNRLLVLASGRIVFDDRIGDDVNVDSILQFLNFDLGASDISQRDEVVADPEGSEAIDGALDINWWRP